MWTNLITDNIIIGSSINLGQRFKDYFNLSHISNPKRSNSIIHKALIKYGYSNFQLEILEFCKPDFCLKIEQYYIDLLKPQYNNFKYAGSSIGYKHNQKILEKMQIFLKNLNAKKRLPVEITDTITNQITKYESIIATGKALNTNEKNVRYAAKKTIDYY